jgi:predicted enzyme related to lactoylglutathione lyase
MSDKTSDKTSDNTGKFVWCEWMGADIAGAVDFYRHVVGWTIESNDMAGFPYNIASVGGYGVGGLFPTPPMAKGTPPCWTGDVWVDDVDLAVARLNAAGGRVLREPMDIPHVGRMAVVADNQGAPFALFRDAGGNPPPKPAAGTPGLIGWRELHAADGEKAFGFYAGQFGWTEARQFDMGAHGVYRIFSNGGEEGGIMTKTPNGPGPCWLYYFDVEAADAAGARVAAKGGKVVNGPNQVPTGQWAMQCVDREGAMFGLVAPRR